MISGILLFCILLVLLVAFVPGFITGCLIALAWIVGIALAIFALIWAFEIFGYKTMMRNFRWTVIGLGVSAVALLTCWIFV